MELCEIVPSERQHFLEWNFFTKKSHTVTQRLLPLSLVEP
jgi:hypothetical protein